MSSLVVRCSPQELTELTERAKSLRKSRAALIRCLLWPKTAVATSDITPAPDISVPDITSLQEAVTKTGVQRASEVSAPERCGCGDVHKRCPRCGRVHQKQGATRCQRCTARLV